MNMISLKLITKEAIRANVDVILHMRIENFRKFPYLYQGNLDYEKKYIQGYLNNPQSILIAGFVGDSLIAISTGLPLTSNTELLEQAKPLFEKHGFKTNDYFYFAETIIDENYQGQGLYTKIVRFREQVAQEKGFQKGCFATVIRDNNHPLMPANYQSPEPIFKHCGYHKTSMVFHYHWPTIQADGSVVDQENAMVFWIKDF